MQERRPGRPAFVPAGAGPAPLQTIVPGAIGALLRQSPLSDGKVAFAWRVAVGPGVDRASHARLAASGLLEVTAADARWQREIKRSMAIIVPRLNALLGPDVVRSITVRVERT